MINKVVSTGITIMQSNLIEILLFNLFYRI